jgi:hypothetical protein
MLMSVKKKLRKYNSVTVWLWDSSRSSQSQAAGSYDALVLMATKVCVSHKTHVEIINAVHDTRHTETKISGLMIAVFNYKS